MKNLKLRKGLALLVLVCMLFTIMPMSAFAAPQKQVTVTVHFMDLNDVSQGSYNTTVGIDQKYLTNLDLKQIPEGYELAGIKQDLRIKSDNGYRFVAIRVVKVKTERVSLIADPVGSVSTPAVQLRELPKAFDGTVKVPKADQYFTLEKGYRVKEIMATGFNGHNDSSFKVREGQSILVTDGNPIIRYVFTDQDIQKKKVTFLAGPDDAVAGDGVSVKEMTLDANGKLIVPEDTEIFTPNKDYVLKGISATGFNFRPGTFQVKAGEALTVTDSTPIIKYVYEKSSEDIVVMTIGSKTININGDKKEIDTPAMIKDERTFVPFRALAEAFGARVDYDDETRTITAKLDGTEVVMEIGSRMYSVDGKAKFMDVAPFIENNRTMIPIRFVAEAFGIAVSPTYNADGTTANVVFVK